MYLFFVLKSKYMYIFQVSIKEHVPLCLLLVKTISHRILLTKDKQVELSGPPQFF